MGELATIRSGLQGRSAQSMDEAFPTCDPLIAPLGNQVLVQMRVPKKRAGNIILTDESKDYDRGVIRVAKVISIGAIAFKNRGDMSVWPEGAWVKVGDYVRVPSYAGIDSWRVRAGEHEEEQIVRGEIARVPVEDWVTFAMFNDYDMKGRILGNPLDIVDYV